MASSRKLALVTGASRGIGQAIALALLKEGYAVACGYCREKRKAEALSKTYPEAFSVKIDIHNRVSVRKAMAAIEKKFHRPVDIVINNAAIADEKPFAAITDEDWNLMLETNLRGPFIVAQETLPAMAKNGWGRI